MENAAVPVKAACGRGRRAPIGPPMSDGNQERAERLAAALRENLRRRKEQARALAQPDAATPEEAPARPPRSPT